MRQQWHLAAVAGLVAVTLASGGAYTPKHEAGRCALRGNCGKTGFFGPELPCVDNEVAEEPEDEVRKQLVGICGPKWDSGPVCCAGEQV
jgi:Niemann-Pick C1 protein